MFAFGTGSSLLTDKKKKLSHYKVCLVSALDLSIKSITSGHITTAEEDSEIVYKSSEIMRNYAEIICTAFWG